MTPQEKAQELFDKYYAITGPFFTEVKKCALIAVDEILSLCWNGNEVSLNYWQEVKQEIINL